jgi:hypothetical protein
VNIVVWNGDLEDKRNNEIIGGGGGKMSISKEDVIFEVVREEEGEIRISE